MIKFVQTTAIVFTILVFLFLGMVLSSQADTPKQKYGILGKPAPELMVQAWVDENGAAMDPLPLSEFKGKVVYLLFFQDW